MFAFVNKYAYIGSKLLSTYKKQLINQYLLILKHRYLWTDLLYPLSF